MARDDRTILSEALRQEVLVTLLDDVGVRGILWRVDDDGYLLRRSAVTDLALYSHNGTEPEVIDQGEVFVPRGRVLFVQLLGKES